MVFSWVEKLIFVINIKLFVNFLSLDKQASTSNTSLALQQAVQLRKQSGFCQKN